MSNNFFFKSCRLHAGYRRLQTHSQNM